MLTPTASAVCIIPARGGSKRLPRKNLAMLGGKPLLHWVIGAAVQSDVFRAVYVSTEDAEIAESARLAGAAVINRPAKYAEDGVSLSQVGAQALLQLRYEGMTPDVACISAPTAPLVSPRDFRESYRWFMLAHDADVMHSITPFDHTPQRAVAIRGDRTLTEVPGWLYSRSLVQVLRGQSQDFSELYRIVDAFHWVRVKRYLVVGEFHVEGRMEGFVVPRERAVDIDDAVDLAVAEALLGQKRRAEAEAKSGGNGKVGAAVL